MLARARARGNLVRAAWLASAAGGDPGPDLEALAARLDAWLPDAAWLDTLRRVLARADGLGSVAARLLFDLQKACLESERPPERLALLAWAASLGREPLRRRLDALGVVRATLHVRRAAARATALACGDDDPIAARLEHAAEHAEARLRDRLRAAIAEPLGAATPAATSRVERAARAQAVEELLDRVAAKGRCDFPTLRDAVARSHAKLADLRARDVAFDPLARADRRLARALDGVHRPAEGYRRLLHVPSTLAFGTALGRRLTKLVLLPIIGAYLVLEGLQHTLVLALEALTQAHLPLVGWASLAATSVGVALLVNVPAVRRASWRGLRALGRGLRFALWTLPGRLFALPPVRRVGRTLATLVVVALGPRLVAWLGDGLARARAALVHDLVPGLVRWVLAVFKAVVDAFERALYAVDERLRFRVGDPRRRIAVRFVLALPWRALSWLMRLYVNVLLEPKYNPVKHFPVVTVGHKIILPMAVTLTEALRQPLLGLGPTAATTIAATTVFLLPGLFGFLAWELKETWRVYARNRPRDLRPALVGSHGETARRLLRPGFHSGTLPKLFARFWRAARRGHPLPAALRHARLHHVAVDVARWVERDALAVCALAGEPLTLGRVDLASGRIRLSVAAPAGPTHVVTLSEQGGWIVGACAPPPAPRSALALALDGLWRRGAVDVLAADIAAALPPGSAWDLDGARLVSWPDPSPAGYTTEVVETLDAERDTRCLATRPLAWDAWVAAWEARGAGQGLSGGA